MTSIHAPIPQSRTASNQWEAFGYHQLELDFDPPTLRMFPNITPADLVLDKIYLIADEHTNDPILSAIADLCREYFYEQDGR